MLQALREENVTINYISGTSSGSIVASLFASGYTPYNILDIFNRHCREITKYDTKFPLKVISNMLNPRTSIVGLVDGNRLEGLLNMYFSNKNITNINELKLNTVIPAVDINSGKIIYFSNKKIENEDPNLEYCYSENLAAIVRASSAFPGFFEPRKYKNYMLIDGGIRKNIPVKVLKDFGADNVVAISFIDKNRGKVKDGSIISVVIKCFDIMGEEICKEELDMADIIINPDVGDISLLSCNNLTKIANAGYYAIKNNILKIKQITK